jgi:hypothetical protein
MIPEITPHRVVFRAFRHILTNMMSKATVCLTMMYFGRPIFALVLLLII